jgi:acyl-homoserine lactone acylase PvdQ
VDSDCVSYAVSGPQAPVEILMDRWGVPHVYTSSRYDAFFAQGGFAPKFDPTPELQSLHLN